MINKEFCKDTHKAIRNLIENQLLKFYSFKNYFEDLLVLGFCMLGLSFMCFYY